MTLLIANEKGEHAMSYYFSKIVSASFDETVTKVTDELKKEGFGILTEIDVKETLKKKLNVDFKRYKILGACNPPFAYKALTAEDKIGVMLPSGRLRSLLLTPWLPLSRILQSTKPAFAPEARFLLFQAPAAVTLM